MRQLVPMMTDKGSLARRPLLHLDLPVVVVMAGVGVVEMAGDEVVRMIAVRDGGMAASGAVLVAGDVFAKRDSCKPLADSLLVSGSALRFTHGA